MNNVKLKDILETVIDNRGKTPNTVDTGIPLLEVNAISNNDKYPDYSVIRKYISEETYNTMRSGNPQKGDILIGTVGSIGTIGMMDETKGAIAQNLIALRPKSDVNPHWLYYYLIYKLPDILNLNIGGVQPSIKVPHLLNLEICVPDKKTQDDIANKIVNFDEKIQKNKYSIKRLNEYANSVYEKNIVSDFEEYKLSDVASFSVGGDKPKVFSEEKTDDNQYPIYSNSSVNDGIFGYTNEYKIDKESVTVSARGTIGYLCLRKQKYYPIVRLISVFPNEDILSPELLYLALQHIDIVGTGSTQPQLTVPLFKDHLIKLPTMENKEELSKKIIQIFNLIELYKNQNDLLINLRRLFIKSLLFDN